MSNSNYSASRIAKNTLALYIRSFVSMAIGLYSSRLLLQILGVDDFGIFNVVGGMVMLFSFLNASLAVASQRYLNYEMGKGDIQGVNRVFCMSVNILFILAIVMSLISEVTGLHLLYNYLKIPEERLYAAFWVLQFSILSLFVTVLSVPYNALIIAKEDMRSFAYVDIWGSVLKLLAVVTLSYTSFDRLIVYSLFVLLIQTLLLIIYSKICRKKFVEVHFHLIWDSHLFAKMLSFCGWTSLSGITMIVRNQGIAVLYNAFCGVAVSAAIGIATQVNNALNTLVHNFTTSFNPQIVKNYASGEWIHCKRLHISGPKISFFLLSIVASPFFLFGDYILNLWLETVPPYSILFIHLILIDTLLKSLSCTCNTVVRATGHIKSYELVYNIGVCIFIALAYVCFVLNLSLAMPFICLITATALLNLYMSRKSCGFLGLKWTNYLFYVFVRMGISYVLPLTILYMIDMKCSSLESFIGLSIVCMLFVAVCEYFVGFACEERKFVTNSFLKIRDKLIK